MTELKNIIDTPLAISILCEEYKLNEKEFTKMLETLGCITPEQRKEILTTCIAFAVKDMLANMKGVKS